MKEETLEAVLAARAASVAVVLATDLAAGDESLVRPHDAESPGTEIEALLAAAGKALSADRSGVWETDTGRVFLHVYNTPVRIVIIGAVHIAQPLSAMAMEAGFDVVVVDPRTAFATEARFPGIRLEHGWPAESLKKLGLDRRTALVTVTHDPKLDDPALQAGLRSPAFYLGALGSRRTHSRRIARLEEAGFGAEDIERIHAPVGLDIGARTPGEIASSVLADIVKTLRAPTE